MPGFLRFTTHLVPPTSSSTRSASYRTPVLETLAEVSIRTRFVESKLRKEFQGPSGDGLHFASFREHPVERLPFTTPVGRGNHLGSWVAMAGS
jgi:hypothetical protein